MVGEKMHRENWDDLRFVLAVAETGSVSAASRLLGVNHATVLRRIAAFEDQQGVEVFERSPQGYKVPADKLRVIEAAREVETAVGALRNILRGKEARLSGVVTVTSTDSLCLSVLPDVLVSMRSQLPDLRIELHSTNDHVDLSRFQADLSVRPAQQLPPDLTGEIAGYMQCRAYRKRGAAPDTPWLAMRGLIGRTELARHIEATVDPDSYASGADSFAVLAKMVAAGLGQAVLPVCVAATVDDLEQVDLDVEAGGIPIWVASHAELATAPRLRSVRKVMRSLIAQHPLIQAQ